MAVAKSTFTCTDCGWTTPKWVGRCGECQAWDTMQEGKAGGGRGLGTVRQIKPVAIVGSSAAKPITDISTERVAAWSTQVGEFDRVLGGGIVPGSVMLLGGEHSVTNAPLRFHAENAHWEFNFLDPSGAPIGIHAPWIALGFKILK